MRGVLTTTPLARSVDLVRRSVSSAWIVVPALLVLDCAPLPPASHDARTATGSQASAGPTPIGWASVPDMDLNGTTGGGALPPIEVRTAEELLDEIDRSDPVVIRIVGTITGTFEIGDNKTLEGAPGATLVGSLAVKGSMNVIVRNLRIVGYNCGDAEECRRGKDAVLISEGAHHVWFDHCDVSDGSDGNFDIVTGSDYVTVSWTKFSYSGRRAGGHAFSNLISSSDNSADTDEGHLKITFHHCWWADNIQERMPRARFARIHIFNSLWTTADNKYCMGPGVDAQYLVENSVFSGVNRPTNLKWADAKTVVVSRGNIFENTQGPLEERPGPIFTPPYPYQLDPAEGVKAAVMAGAGPRG